MNFEVGEVIYNQKEEPIKQGQVTIKIFFNPFPTNKFQTLPNWKSLQMTISNLMKMAESSLKG